MSFEWSSEHFVNGGDICQLTNERCSLFTRADKTNSDSLDCETFEPTEMFVANKNQLHRIGSARSFPSGTETAVRSKT